MPSVIQSQFQQLPPKLQRLLGATFRPEQHRDVLYLPSTPAPQSLAKVALALSLFLTVPAALFFGYALMSSASAWLAHEAIRSEMIGISLAIAVLPLGLTLLSLRYVRAAKKLQKSIENREFLLGLWITPSHIIQRDLNEGLQCVARKDIDRLEIYQSGRPPLSMCIIHLHNGQRLRVVANWLDGHEGKIMELHGFLTKKLILQARFAEPIDAFFRDLQAGGLGIRAGETRWDALMRFLEQFRLTQRKLLQPEDYACLLTHIDKALDQWDIRERVAPQNWWQVFVSDGDWEYGVNGVGVSRDYFNGFKVPPHADWRLPLARCARFESQGDMRCTYAEFLNSFRNTAAFDSLVALDWASPMSKDCLRDIVQTDRFGHLQQLSVDTSSINDPDLLAQFENWRTLHAVAEI